jgi:hypothetical protein
MAETVKVSFEVKNVRSGMMFGHTSTRTAKFDDLTAAAKFVRKIYRGLQINGYEVLSDPLME